MLSMLEEVVLLAVDTNTGKMRASYNFGSGYALAGALFFDLALGKKIDTDVKEVHVINTLPEGNPAVDMVLDAIVKNPQSKTVKSWIEYLAGQHEVLENAALQMLIEKGILKHEKSKLLWMIDVERFPVVDDKPQQHVKVRLAQAILDDTIPRTRDIMLVSIAEASGLLNLVLSDEELRKRQERINALCGFETISRTVAEAIYELAEHIRWAGRSHLGFV
jgi:golgi phosphoprotein 3